jgi:energy-coupling factor transporter transmembrane protein EcfT
MSREHHAGCIPSLTMSPWLSSAFGAGIHSCTTQPSDAAMKVLLLFIAWCVLFVLRPIALLALIAAPIVWLLSLPLRLIGVCVESILALLRAVLLFYRTRAGPSRMIRRTDMKTSPNRGNQVSRTTQPPQTRGRRACRCGARANRCATATGVKHSGGRSWTRCGGT